ncbi:MAG TPA: adenylate/guanylate cyclase domain-containing protein [Roseiflexaceae bacterium]|nr:adenylate/guanylate cyclase domain-containing protein [Roseiflexaceae bacterium]
MVVSQRQPFAPRLSFKITLPYVALALILALATIYIVARTQAAKVTSEFSRQIEDARVRVADSVVLAEKVQVANVRTIARLDGLAEAVQAGDAQAIVALVDPYAVSQGVERIVIVGADGRALVALHNRGAEALPVAPADQPDLPGVRAVLEQRSDNLGDKYVELVHDRDEIVLYTIAPIYSANTLSGALLVGTTARTLVERWRGATLADVTLYAADGAPLATSLGSELPTPLEASQRGERPSYRDVVLGSRDYGEVVAPLWLRGDPTDQFIGVAISTAGQENLYEQAEFRLLPIFGIGLLATFVLGIVLSRRITRPIFALVDAAEGVASGDLDRVLPVTTGDEIGALTSAFNTMIGGLRERERMHDILGRFVSPTVARLVLSQPLDLRGETKLLTILFTDLRDFTVLSEQEEPAVVISGLNAYFRIVVEAADRYGGVVNKFGGDSTLVLFGLTDEGASSQASAEAAVRAALDIRAGLSQFNTQRAAEGTPLLAAGIGINTGTVVAGLIGAERRMEYTVIGDAVNLSARIQTLNRKLDTDILISDATYQALGQPDGLRVVNRGLRQLKGKSLRVRVYSVSGWESGDAA